MIEIIAEIGVNHNGDLDTAQALIRQARYSGCDTVKFQLFTNPQRYPDLQLSAADLTSLKVWAEGEGLRFLCTPDDMTDAVLLRDEVKVDRIKIGSSNITNLPLIREIAKWGIPLILSTGACTRVEVLAAVQAASLANPKRLPDVMHCVSAYPAPVQQMNFRVFHDPAIRYTGFSDHTDGSTFAAAIMAVALGARVIEKHLTLNIHDKGPDHLASIEPHEMSAYVQQLRIADQMMGTGIKLIQPCEELNRKAYEEFVRGQYADSPAV